MYFFGSCVKPNYLPDFDDAAKMMGCRIVLHILSIDITQL